MMDARLKCPCCTAMLTLEQYRRAAGVARAKGSAALADDMDKTIALVARELAISNQ